jgi:hypothetical protein
MAQDRGPQRPERDEMSIEEEEARTHLGHDEDAERHQPPPVDPAPGGLFERIYSAFRRPRRRKHDPERNP